MKDSDFQANVVLASRPYRNVGPDLVTIHVKYPRFVHSELMTHRVFSRNARSSRAAPFKTFKDEPIYVPHFLKNKPGMQATEEFSYEELEELQVAWEKFAELTQEFQQYLVNKGVHKQWANRPGEWFGYIDVLITATEWDNFFSLRLHPAAQPEIQALAKVMDAEIKDVIQNNEVQFLSPGEWHIPYADKDRCLEDNLKLSVARCARISYAPFDGNASLEKEFQRHELLRYANPIHASPFEHQAQVEVVYDYDCNYIRSNFARPWNQYRKIIGQ